MRLPVILLCFLYGNVLQAQTVKVSVKRQQLSTVLLDLGEKYGAQFSFDDNLLAPYIITKHKTYTNVAEAVYALTASEDLNVKFFNGVYIITHKPKLYSFMGYIYDSTSSLPIADAIVKSYKQITKTEQDGYFFITDTVPVLSVEISHLSYYQKQQKLYSENEACIELLQKNIELPEVIITTPLHTNENTRKRNASPSSGIRPVAVYRSLKNFLLQKPDSESERAVQVKPQGFQINYFYLPAEKKLIENKTRLFGFRDSTGIYVNAQTPILKRATPFFRADFIGPFVHFVMVEELHFENSVIYFPADKLIDKQSGKVTWLTRNTLRTIIKDDAALLQLFNNEKKKRSKILSYLKEYYLRKQQ